MGVGLLQVGTGQFTTFLSIRMGLEAFSTLSIGLVGSAYFAGFIIGTYHAVRLVERIGHIRAFAALASGFQMKQTGKGLTAIFNISERSLRRWTKEFAALRLAEKAA